MNCSELDRNSTLYFSHELDDAGSDDFLTHLQACAGCAAKVRATQQMNYRLRAAVLDQELDTRALEFRIRRGLVVQPQRSSPFWRRMALLTAVLLLASAVGLLAHTWLQAGKEKLALCDDAVVDHRVEVVEHAVLKWNTDPAKLAALEQRVLGTEIDPRQYAPAGYHFDRARICLLLDNRYLHLVYSNGAEEFSMFVGAGRRGALSWFQNGPYHTTIGNTDVVQFDGRRFSFVVVGQGTPSLLHLANEIAGRV